MTEAHSAYRTAIEVAREVYQALLGRPIDDSGLASSLLLQMEHHYTKADLEDWVKRSREYQQRQPHEPPGDPLVKVLNAPLDPLKGQLRTDGKAYVDDTGRRIPVMCHAGDLIMLFVEGRLSGDQESERRVHGAFADMQRAGYTGLRSWWSICWAKPNPYWEGRRLNPSDREQRRLIEECLRIGAEDYNLRWHLALGSAEDVPKDQMEDAWNWMADVVHKHPAWYALMEGLNEAYHTGEGDPRVVESWVNRSRQKNPQVLHALSAAAGAGGSEELDELKKWTPQWQQLYLIHASRANNWGDMTRHVFTCGYEHPPTRLGWSGEPPGVNWNGHTKVSGMSRAAQWIESPWRYAFYMAQTAMARQVPTYMCSYGVWLRGRFRDAPAFMETPRLIGNLPPDIMAYEQLFHGGTTHKQKRVVVAPEHCRADHALDGDGRCVITVYPDTDPSVTDAELVFDRDWAGRVHDKSGYTDVAYTAGSRVTYDVNSGLLLVGRTL